MEEKLYTVRINTSGRYVKDCDECWYETEANPVPRYTRKRAEEIMRQLDKHYVYEATASNGIDTFAKTLKPQKNEPVVAGTKKNFKIKLKR